MGRRELCDVHTDTDTDAIGFQTHCVDVGAGVGEGKICVGVGQCEHCIRLVQMKVQHVCILSIHFASRNGFY